MCDTLHTFHRGPASSSAVAFYGWGIPEGRPTTCFLNFDRTVVTSDDRVWVCSRLNCECPCALRTLTWSYFLSLQCIRSKSIRLRVKRLKEGEKGKENSSSGKYWIKFNLAYRVCTVSLCYWLLFLKLSLVYNFYFKVAFSVGKHTWFLFFKVDCYRFGTMALYFIAKSQWVEHESLIVTIVTQILPVVLSTL